MTTGPNRILDELAKLMTDAAGAGDLRGGPPLGGGAQADGPYWMTRGAPFDLSCRSTQVRLFASSDST